MVMTAGELATLRGDTAVVAFNHRCTVLREATNSAYEEPAAPSTHLSNQPCFYGQRRVVDESEPGARIVRVEETLLLPLTADIRDSDIVSAITGQSGEALISRARNITDVTRFASHIRITLRSVR